MATANSGSVGKGKSIITKKITIEAGLLLKRQVRNFLKQQQFSNHHVDIEFEELRNFLNSTFLISVTGNDMFVNAWIGATQDMIEEHNDDT